MASNTGGASSANYFALYRRSSIGMSLTDALDELVESGHISPQLAFKVVQEFDKAASNTMSTGLKTKCSAKGHLANYRLCDEVWTFSLRDAMFKLEGGETVGPVSKVKIVAQKGGER